MRPNVIFESIKSTFSQSVSQSTLKTKNQNKNYSGLVVTKSVWDTYVHTRAKSVVALK